MSSFAVRVASEEDAEACSALIHRSFLDLAAKDWSPQAIEVFLGESTPAILRERLQSPAYAALAESESMMVGFVLMTSPSLLSMLFVHPRYQRQGAGRSLWQAARLHVESAFPHVTTVELNTTPVAVTFYRSLGFVPISAEFQRKGARAIRMACWLRARSLGAEIPQ